MEDEVEMPKDMVISKKLHGIEVYEEMNDTDPNELNDLNGQNINVEVSQNNNNKDFNTLQIPIKSSKPKVGGLGTVGGLGNKKKIENTQSDQDNKSTIKITNNNTITEIDEEQIAEKGKRFNKKESNKSNKSKKKKQKKSELDNFVETSSQRSGLSSRTSLIDDDEGSQTSKNSKMSKMSKMSKGSSRRGRGNGASSIVIKAMQDRMENINNQIKSIHDKATENYDKVNEFIEAYLAMKNEWEADAFRRSELERRLLTVDKISRNIESDSENSKK
mmetsp:Transcript_76828/g.166295  ORF Transcript_76828/g.166295 Transcript_76828/m.166295 type:complete len:275 (+) Transcript_76828:321-1145(+)